MGILEGIFLRYCWIRKARIREEYKVCTIWSHVNKTITNQTQCVYIENICLRCGFSLQEESNLRLSGELQPQGSLWRSERVSLHLSQSGFSQCINIHGWNRCNNPDIWLDDLIITPTWAGSAWEAAGLKFHRHSQIYLNTSQTRSFWVPSFDSILSSKQLVPHQ